MGFKKQGLVKAAIALSTFCAAYFLIQSLKPPVKQKLNLPKKPDIAHISLQ